MIAKISVDWANYKNKGSGLTNKKADEVVLGVHENWINDGYIRKACVESCIKPLLELQASLLGFDTYVINELKLVEV